MERVIHEGWQETGTSTGCPVSWEAAGGIRLSSRRRLSIILSRLYHKWHGTCCVPPVWPYGPRKRRSVSPYSRASMSVHLKCPCYYTLERVVLYHSRSRSSRAWGYKSAPLDCSERPPSLPIFPLERYASSQVEVVWRCLSVLFFQSRTVSRDATLSTRLSLFGGAPFYSLFVIYPSRTVFSLSLQWPNLRTYSRPMEQLALPESHVGLTVSVFPVRRYRSYLKTATPAVILRFASRKARYVGLPAFGGNFPHSPVGLCCRVDKHGCANIEKLSLIERMKE